jgi:hypothetical protein
VCQKSVLRVLWQARIGQAAGYRSLVFKIMELASALAALELWFIVQRKRAPMQDAKDENSIVAINWSPGCLFWFEHNKQYKGSAFIED